MDDFKLIFFRHNKNAIPPHGGVQIQFYDLTLILNGKRDYEIDGMFYSLQKDDIIFIPPNTYRKQLPADKADYISFNFTCNDLPALPVFIEKGVSNAVKWLITACDELIEYFPTDNTQALSHIAQSIISILISQNNLQKKHPLIVAIEKYIAKNLQKKITLADIGEITHYSPIYCDIIFKRETGQSIIGYLTDHRIIEAKKLIIDSLLSLKEVAENVGFEDYNYFSRIFKKKTGYTPTQFRNLVNKSQNNHLLI